MTAPLAIPALIVGAGAWGTAMAVQWSKRAMPGVIQLYGRDAQAIAEMRRAGTNQKYLPGITLPPQLVLE